MHLKAVLRPIYMTFIIMVTTLALACGGSAPGTKTPRDGVASAPIPGPSLGATEAPLHDDGAEEGAAVPIASDDPQSGRPDAYVTIVVFSDFQCPFCGRFAAVLGRLRNDYSPEDLRIVFKNEPLRFHDRALPAAEVGAGVFALKGSDAFWRYHDRVFHRQEHLSDADLRTYAIEAGVDAVAFDRGLEQHAWLPKVQRDLATSERVGSSGTPTSFVNGVLVSGAKSYEQFKSTIDAEAARAKDYVAKGVPRRAVYRAAVADAFKKTPARDDEEDDEAGLDTTVHKVPIGPSPVRGKATALVTIVEFSDYQCPFCKRVESTMEQIRKEYGDKVRFVWKDEPLPFHGRAEPAAELARFARGQKGDPGFWDVHDRLFASQPSLEDADLERIASAAGLDAAKAMAAVRAKTYAKGIAADAELADDVEAGGTPHFFINGRRVVGAQPYEKFKTVVDGEVAKAEALVKSGVAASAVYDRIMKDAKGPPEPEQRTLAVPSTAPFRGPANAPVVIQEFSDFQCPFCGRVESTLEELFKAYPGKIKLVWRDKPLPMHSDAQLAAEAAREAHAQKGNEGFTKMRALLFGAQGKQGLKRSELEAMAQQLGLDMKKFGDALDQHRHKAVIEADDKAASAAGINGTPAFIIGNYYLSGAQPIAKFQKLVERTLKSPR